MLVQSAAMTDRHPAAGEAPLAVTPAEIAAQRILTRCYEAADMILLHGGIPWDIDETMVDFGFPIGPYQAQDLAGLDIGYARRKASRASRDPARRYVTISDRMVEEGRIGKKGGVGWYRYPGGGGAVEDPLVEDLVAEESWFAKVSRRRFGREEILRRLLAAMIDEAAQIVAGGSLSCEELDRLSVERCGFPAKHGGLLHHASAYGFDLIIAELAAFSADDCFMWSTSPALLARADAPRSLPAPRM